MAHSPKARGPHFDSAVSKLLAAWSALVAPEPLGADFTRFDPALRDQPLGPKDWEELFAQALERCGPAWLAQVAPLAEQLCIDHALPVPRAYLRALPPTSTDNSKMAASCASLQARIVELESQSERCSLTGLPNDSHFRRFMVDKLTEPSPALNQAHVLFIAVDNMLTINLRYGDSVGDEAIKACSYVIRSALPASCSLFRLPAASFALFVPSDEPVSALAIAENIRHTVNDSSFFLEQLSVSVGVVAIGDELGAGAAEAVFERIKSAGRQRLKTAQQQGANTVCASAATADEQTQPLIVCADTDPLTLEILKTALEASGYRVVCCQDGKELLETVDRLFPNFIITELLLPKMDAFAVRIELNRRSVLGKKPFMIVSRKKDDVTVERSIELEIEYYLKKPFFLNEILGIVNRRCREDRP